MMIPSKQKIFIRTTSKNLKLARKAFDIRAHVWDKSAFALYGEDVTPCARTQGIIHQTQSANPPAVCRVGAAARFHARP